MSNLSLSFWNFSQGEETQESAWDWGDHNSLTFCFMMCYFSWNSFSSHFIYPVWYYTMHFQIVLPSKWFFPFSLLLITKYIYYFVSIVWCHSITSVTLSFIAIYQMKCWFIFLAWRAHNLYFHAQKCKENICIGLESPPLDYNFCFWTGYVLGTSWYVF